MVDTGGMIKGMLSLDPHLQQIRGMDDSHLGGFSNLTGSVIPSSPASPGIHPQVLSMRNPISLNQLLEMPKV